MTEKGKPLSAKLHVEILDTDTDLGVIPNRDAFALAAREQLPTTCELFHVCDTVYARGSKSSRTAAAWYADGWRAACGNSTGERAR